MPLFKNALENARINREIAALESKKGSLIKSVGNDMQAANAKITAKFAEIGALIYDMNESGAVELEKTAPLLEEITALKETITEKEAKIKEICERYDEDIKLLRNLISNTSNATAASACAACGAARKGASDKFCQHCGTMFP